MNEYKDLQVFILRKFLFVILFISAAEYVILLLLRYKVLPIVMHFFFDDADVAMIGVAGLLFLLLILGGMLLLQLLNFIIPGETGYVMGNALNSMNIRGSSFLNTNKAVLGDLTTGQEVVLFLVLAVYHFLMITFY